MKNLIKKAIYVFLFVACSMITRAQLKLDGMYDEFVCPGQQTCYIINLNYKIADVTWTTTNGSFSPIEKVTTKRGDLNGTCVYWDNVASSNGNVPSGSVVASVTYKLSENDFRTTTTNTITQKIKSLKGVTPPSITSSISSNALPFGTQNINIDFSSAFYYPGTKLDGSKMQVTKYEWTLPDGWQGSGKTGTFVTALPKISIITNKIGTGTVKVRGVSDCALDNNSNYSQITFKRTFGFTNYPSSIKFGEIQLLTYQVTPIEGVEYEWSLPAGWTKVSGGNTKTVILAKSICAVSADVKVRLKAGSEYSEWYTCPNTTMLPPDMTIPTIEQFRNVNIAINIPSDQIQSFSVSGDGVSTVGGQGTNTLVCRFDKTGSKELNVSLTLKGCGSSYSFKKTVQVSNVNLTISAPDMICPNDPTAYSLYDLPEGATVVWSCTSGAIIKSGGTSTTCWVEGKTPSAGAVYATVTIRGVSVKVTKNMEVSTDPNSEMNKAYINYYNSGNYTHLSVSMPQIFGLRGFNWNAQALVGGSGHSKSGSTGTAGDYFTVDYGAYYVECRVVTQCGHILATAYVNSSGYSSKVYPNPVEQTLFIDINNQMKDIQSAEVNALSASSPSSESVYEIRLFNIQGTLVRSMKSEEGQTTMDVSNLPNGNYFLHIYKDSGTTPETHKIVIRH